MSYERNQAISLAYRIFSAEEWGWHDNLKPTYEDVEQLFESLEQSAYKIKGFAESGRIQVHYDNKSQMYEYYLDLGAD